MAKYTIDEATWIANYPKMITIQGATTSRLMLVILVLIILITGGIALHQYLGSAFALILFVMLIKRYWWVDKSGIARKAYRAAVLPSSTQEVVFKDDNILIIVEGASFKLSWEYFEKVIYLPDLIFLRHRFLNFYVVASALSESERELFERRVKDFGIISENRET